MGSPIVLYREKFKENEVTDSEEARMEVDWFLMQPSYEPEGLEVSVPEAFGYEFLSGCVIERFQKWYEKFCR